MRFHSEPGFSAWCCRKIKVSHSEYLFFVFIYLFCLAILLSVKYEKSWLIEAIWLYFIMFHSSNLISSLHLHIHYPLRLLHMNASCSEYIVFETSITSGTGRIVTSLWTLSFIEFALLSCCWEGYSDIISIWHLTLRSHFHSAICLL